MKSIHSYLFLFVVGLFLIIVSPMLFSDGMFMDGIYYATISRNWAEGLSTFWKPIYTSTLGNPFYDHPPLVFFMEGLFFKIFGDHYFTERFYSFCTYGGLVMLFWAIWAQIVKESHKKIFWAVVLFWISISKVTWSVSNNLLENTLMLFTSASILFFILYFKNRKSQLFLLLAGFSLFLGFLAKGFVAFFPLSFLFFYFLFFKNYTSHALLKDYVKLIFYTFFPFLLIYLFFPTASAGIQNYIEIQVFASLQNVQNVPSRFFILGRFFEEILVMLSLTLLLQIINRWKLKIDFPKHYLPWIWTLTCVGMSGIFPIMVSLKQSTFYINPVFPLFAMVFILLNSEIILTAINALEQKKGAINRFKLLGLLTLFSGLGLNLFFSNKVMRDQEMLSDIRSIIKEVPPSSTLYISEEIAEEWSVYAYFYRYGHISFSRLHPEKYTYMVKKKNSETSIPNGFVLTNKSREQLELYYKP